MHKYMSDYVVYNVRFICIHCKSMELFEFDCVESFQLIQKHSIIRSWNQPVMSNECKVSISRKQRLESMQLAILRLLVRRVNHSTTPPHKCTYLNVVVAIHLHMSVKLVNVIIYADLLNKKMKLTKTKQDITQHIFQDNPTKLCHVHCVKHNFKL